MAANFPFGPTMTNELDDRSAKQRRQKLEMNLGLAALFILWLLGFAMMVQVSGAPHQAWHNWHYYLPLACAAPFTLRFLYLWLFAK